MTESGSSPPSAGEVLARDLEVVDEILRAKDSVREEVIRVVRELVRLSGDSTRRVHLRDFEGARESLDRARSLVEGLRDRLREHPDLYYSGLAYSGLSEYVEARVLYSLVVEGRLPSFEELEVPHVPYLQGLGDAVGELRRHVLSLIDSGDLEGAARYLEVMEAIYLQLRRLSYPDPLTPGLRQKVDAARRLVEDTKSLLVSVRSMARLSKLIEGEARAREGRAST